MASTTSPTWSFSLSAMATTGRSEASILTTARSDFLGRASGILYEQLITQEGWIMNPCNTVTEGTSGPTTVFASGQTTAQPGDVPFNVTTTITNIATNAWRVSVLVAWTGHPGISETLVVTRQEGFRTPGGCP